MKNKAVIIISFVLCLLLAGCVANTSKQPETTESDTISTTEKETKKEEGEEPDELYVLRNKIKKADCVLGIAFVDYETSELSLENTQIYLNQSETINEYPFLHDIKTVSYDGIQLYIFVPASRESVITIYPNNITDEGEFEVNREKIIYKSKPGEPIALRCNEHENYSNVLVSVTNDDEVYEFYPMISLEDGWSVALEDGCYDFSVDNILKYANDASYMLPKSYSEIQDAINNGKDLIFAGSFYFCDQMMLRFELGQYTDDSYSEDSFVCEKQYAVAFNTTYSMDPKDHKWYVIGNGLVGMGLVK